MQTTTSDFFDADPEHVLVCETQFRSFGRVKAFAGPCRTVRVLEDHRDVKELLASPGNGHVLVVDGNGSTRAGLLGDNMAEMAMRNGWAGAVLFGAVRDSAALDLLDFGVKAVATTARRAAVHAAASIDVPIAFGGITFRPGDWVCADQDAVAVRPQR